MKVFGKKLKALTSVIAIIGVILICICFVNNAPFNSNIKNSTKIEIKDGTNGKLYVLESEDASTLSNKLLNIDVKVAGLNSWSSGYKYKIEIFTKNNSEDIIIKSKNSFIKGILRYETKEDIVKLVEDAIKE